MIACFGVVASACGSALDVPVPPDMSGLVRAYERPRGELTVANVVSVLSVAAERLGIFTDARPALVIDPTFDALDEGVREAEAAPRSDAGARHDGAEYFRFDAVVGVTRTCAGWDPGEAPDPIRNGRMTLTTAIRDGRIDRVAWGRAERCRERAGSAGDDTRVTLDGDIAIYRYDPYAKSAASSRLLFAVRGTVAVNDVVLAGSFDFRVAPSMLEVRVVFPDGTDVVCARGPADFLFVRTVADTYFCQPALRECAVLGGDTILTW